MSLIHFHPKRSFFRAFLPFPLLFLGAAPCAFAASPVLVGGYFGNQAVVDSFPTPVPLTFNQQMSFSFEQRTDELISAVWVHGTPVGACPDYTAWIVGDDGSGLPDMGNILGGDTDNMVNGWTKISFLGPVNVVSGNIYHVVLTSQGSATGTDYYALDAYTPPWTQWIPFDQYNDGALNALHDLGSGFAFVDAQPLFAVEYGGANYGNPYATISSAPVSGTSYVSQVFQAPAGNIWVGEVGAYLQRSGSPNGALLYQLENLTVPATLSSGTLATNATATAPFGWVDVPLAGGPFQLNPLHQYRLTFSSPGTSGAFYRVNTPANPNPATALDSLTFDGTSSFYAFSSNSGGAWAPNVSADLAFRLRVTGPATATPTFSRTATQSSTPTATRTSTPCALAVSGLTVIGPGTFNYCDVRVFSGGQLSINGATTFIVSGNFTVDNGGQIIGLARGHSAGVGSAAGGGPAPGGAGSGASLPPWGGGGGGHGGIGGQGGNIGGPGGSPAYDAAAIQEGSGGGGGSAGVPGGPEGPCLVVLATGNAVLDGLLNFNGGPGGASSGTQSAGGGGGAGGSIHIEASNIQGTTGSLTANGGQGGNGNATVEGYGGGGGGGGRVYLCASNSYSYAGSMSANFGAGGTGLSGAGSPGFAGTTFICGLPTPTSTSTPTPTVTLTATATSSMSPTATLTASPTATSSSTSTSTASMTATPSFTATLTATPTASPSFTSTSTWTPTSTATATSTSTQTPSFTPTPSPTSTSTQSSTSTSSATPTDSATPTASMTATPSLTGTATLSPSSTATLTATPTATDTLVPTFTSSSTQTETSTATRTATPSATPTRTSTSTPAVATAVPAPNRLLSLSSNSFDPGVGPLAVDFQTRQAGRVKVKVLNISGELVATLFDQAMAVGTRSVSWAGFNDSGALVGNGIYFILVETPGEKMVLKVIVLK